MWWLFWGIVFVLSAGFAKVSTEFLNRLLALKQPKWLITFTELVQVLCFPIFVWLVIRGLNRILLTSSFESPAGQENTVLFTGLILLGSVGFIVLVRDSVRYLFYRPPACQMSNDSKIIDFRRREPSPSWQTTLVGPGPMRSLALLPGNEQFKLEVSTTTFVLPRLPKTWDGLSIVHFADTHFCGAVSRTYFEEACEQASALAPDLFVFTGDLLDDPALLSWLPETLGRLKAPLGQYFILGNHDWYHNAAEIRDEFRRHGWIDLASRSLEITSSKCDGPIVLAGDETPWMGAHADLSAQSKDRFRILLSHTPDNIVWARDNGIDLMLAGHTHGGQIRLPLLGPVYSPSRFGCRFASGAFWLEPTLMYVSRGLSGREPIRYLCVPELTKLVLKTADS